MYYDEAAAKEASDEFDRMFREKQAPDDMPEVESEWRRDEGEGLWIVKALAEAGLVKSNGDARRMIQQNAVRVDGERVGDVDRRAVQLEKSRIGSRWASVPGPSIVINS